MGYVDRERRMQEQQEAELSTLMDSLIADKHLLLDKNDRNRLTSTPTTINHLRETPSGFGVISEVEFTILGGTTFMWSRKLPAAIAYGRIHGQSDLLLTGAVFYPGSLRRTGIDPTEIDFFPALIAEIPGHFNQFNNSLGFRITTQGVDSYRLTFGGVSPETRLATQISGSNKPSQIMNILNSAVSSNIPRV